VDHRQAETELLESIEPRVERVDQGLATVAVGADDRIDDRLMLVEEFLPNARADTAVRGFLGGVDERVGHPAHRGGHDDDLVTLVGTRNRQLRRLRNPLGRPDGGPAEFHDNQHVCSDRSSRSERSDGSGRSIRSSRSAVALDPNVSNANDPQNSNDPNDSNDTNDLIGGAPAIATHP
jgi:hypothetical protein